MGWVDDLERGDSGRKTKLGECQSFEWAQVKAQMRMVA